MVSRRALRGTQPLGHVPSAEPVHCPLCSRLLVPGRSVDEHHLVPKSQGGKTLANTALIHRICHRKIHATFSERELAKDFNTWPALQAHPEIAIFIEWLANKTATFYDNSRKPARRR
jgi:HNH endonuclease